VKSRMTRRERDKEVFAKTIVPPTEFVLSTVIAPALLDLMESLNGLVLTVHSELAQKISLGLELL